MIDPTHAHIYPPTRIRDAITRQYIHTALLLAPPPATPRPSGRTTTHRLAHVWRTWSSHAIGIMHADTGLNTFLGTHHSALAPRSPCHGKRTNHRTTHGRHEREAPAGARTEAPHSDMVSQLMHRTGVPCVAYLGHLRLSTSQTRSKAPLTKVYHSVNAFKGQEAVLTWFPARNGVASSRIGNYHG